MEEPGDERMAQICARLPKMHAKALAGLPNVWLPVSRLPHLKLVLKWKKH